MDYKGENRKPSFLNILNWSPALTPLPALFPRYLVLQGVEWLPDGLSLPTHTYTHVRARTHNQGWRGAIFPSAKLVWLFHRLWYILSSAASNSFFFLCGFIPFVIPSLSFLVVF